MLAPGRAGTMGYYAGHKRSARHGVAVGLEFARIHAADCEDCDERDDGWIERIRSDVTIHGDFDDAQRARLGQVARRCPVHKTLTNGIKIVDQVTFSNLDK